MPPNVRSAASSRVADDAALLGVGGSLLG